MAERQGPKHGTRSRYVTGCRCDDCTRAHCEWQRGYRARRRPVELRHQAEQAEERARRLRQEAAELEAATVAPAHPDTARQDGEDARAERARETARAEVRIWREPLEGVEGEWWHIETPGADGSAYATKDDRAAVEEVLQGMLDLDQQMDEIVITAQSELARLREAATEFDAWLSFRAEFSEVLIAVRKAFGTDTSAHTSEGREDG